jgi:hypothetical protein
MEPKPHQAANHTHEKPMSKHMTPHYAAHTTSHKVIHEQVRHTCMHPQAMPTKSKITRLAIHKPPGDNPHLNMQHMHTTLVDGLVQGK